MADRSCSVEDCTRPWHCREWCKIHYERQRVFGRTELLTIRPSVAAEGAAIVAEYQAGATVRDLAKSRRVRTSVISEILKANGQPVRNGVHRRYTDAEEAQMADEYAAGSSGAEIAKRWGCSGWMVRAVVQRLGKWEGEARQRRVLTDAELDMIRSMRTANASLLVVAKAVPASQVVISQAIRQMGLPSRNPDYVGEKHHAWRGGRYVNAQGYVRICIEPDDPLIEMASASRSIAEHRLVMARSLGRPLNSWETVHHINGDSGDNRIENLQLRIGKHGKGIVLKCRECGSHDLVEVPLEGVSMHHSLHPTVLAT